MYVLSNVSLHQFDNLSDNFVSHCLFYLPSTSLELPPPIFVLSRSLSHWSSSYGHWFEAQTLSILLYLSVKHACNYPSIGSLHFMPYVVDSLLGNSLKQVLVASARRWGPRTTCSRWFITPSWHKCLMILNKRFSWLDLHTNWDRNELMKYEIDKCSLLM